MTPLYIYLKNGQVKTLSAYNRFPKHEYLIRTEWVEIGKMDSEQFIQDLFDRVAKDPAFGQRTLQSILGELISKDNQ